ncbi:MAG: peptide-methionine (S)-S-oxide reductase MsrA [Candidatus Saccharimonadia bacterium]
MDQLQFESTVLGGGCFWCLEAAYQEVAGIHKVTSGYAGGSVPNPSYDQVTSGRTGHAEVVQLEFDPSIITYAEILEIFWILHDPTSLNRQGHDVGTQYRSVIFYKSETQASQAKASIDSAKKFWDKPIVTELAPLDTFYPAEDYQQNYFRNNPDQAYCQIIINPKLTKLRQKFAAKLIKS